MKIEISCPGERLGDFDSPLADRIRSIADQVGFELHPRASRFRAIDPTVLVAIVGGSSAAIGAFLSGILQLAKERRSSKITLQSGDVRIEVPADTPAEEIDELIQKLRSMSKPAIYL